MKHETAGDVLATEDAAVFLRPLTSTTSGDTTTSWTAIGRTSLVHGDYGSFRHATFDELRAHLAEASRDVRLGVWLEGKLIGRIDLNPINPPRWVLGYWLDERLTEKGLMTMACRAAIGHARALGALELYAGVTDGNERSVACFSASNSSRYRTLTDAAGGGSL